MVIDIYADIACPWCYIGEHRLIEALAQRPDVVVERHWRPFQLQPQMPPAGLPWATFAHQKFGGLARMRSMFDRVTAVGAEAGLTFDFDQIATAPNTADAHRLVLLAAVKGKAWQMAGALFEGYFALGCDLNNPQHLLELAKRAGLDADEVIAFLKGSTYKDTVSRSQQQANQLGIQGVPAFIFNNRYLVSGAQPSDVFLQVLDMVEKEAATSS